MDSAAPAPGSGANDATGPVTTATAGAAAPVVPAALSTAAELQEEIGAALLAEDGQLSPTSPLPHSDEPTMEPLHELTLEEQEQLDAETLQLLEDMRNQEAELENILSRHKEDANELIKIRDAMQAELAMLKQEAWKLEAMQDLEAMRGQLDDLLEGNLPDAGATADGEQEGSMSSSDVRDQVGMLLEMEEAALDDELDALRAQLADIKLQAKEMDARRNELVEELASIQMPDQWDAAEPMEGGDIAPAGQGMGSSSAAAGPVEQPVPTSSA